MELINWSLSALDKIFSTRSVAPGEPHCPKSMSMVIGFTLIVAAFALMNWKIGNTASVKDIEKLSGEIKDHNGAVNDWFADFHHKGAQNEGHIRNILTRLENLQTRLDTLMGQGAERCTLSIGTRQEDMAKALAALEFERRRV